MATECRRGSLIVFEGPEGVGKSTLVSAVNEVLAGENDRPVTVLAFPGRRSGTLGHHIYALHHEPSRFGIGTITPTSLQLLHVAAHLDAIDSIIRPRIAQGDIVLLDRYWWSTWVYGITSGADARTLRAMIEIERTHWAELQPDVVFLIRRAAALHGADTAAAFEALSAEYHELAAVEARSAPVVIVDNDGRVEDAVSAVLAVARNIVMPIAEA